MTQQDPAQPALACSQCGRTFAQSNLVQIAGNWVCGDCKPTFLSRLVAGGPVVASSLNYAGVGIRFAARFVDGLIFIIPFFVVILLFMPGMLRPRGTGVFMFNGTLFLVAILFTLFYEVLMLRYWGATLGKMACGLKVVRPDRSSLGWGVSFGRYFMYNVVISSIPFVNWILLLTTAIMAGTDDQRRGLHDRVCDTRVIYTRGVA
jgi:uncharacterized RDD family membrane protein YckC